MKDSSVCNKLAEIWTLGRLLMVFVGDGDSFPSIVGSLNAIMGGGGAALLSSSVESLSMILWSRVCGLGF